MEYTVREEKEGHGYGEEVEGTKGLSAPCLPRINHVSVMLNRWPPARDTIDRIAMAHRWHPPSVISRLGRTTHQWTFNLTQIRRETRRCLSRRSIAPAAREEGNDIGTYFPAIPRCACGRIRNTFASKVDWMLFCARALDDLLSRRQYDL